MLIGVELMLGFQVLFVKRDNYMSEKIEKQLQELSDLEEKIRQDVAKYNRLSSKLDTNMRLALMTASCTKDDDEQTHDQCVEHRDFPPNPYIDAGGADYWFPSSICIGY